MLGWISDDNTDNEVRENSFKPLAKQFFKELIASSSWVKCDKIILYFIFMKEKLYTQPDMCMHKFTILSIGVTSHLNAHGGVFRRIKNKTLLEAALAWEDEDTYKNYVIGKFDVKWADVDFIYTAMNISEHWIVLAMDINRGHIFVFDSLPSYTPMTKLVNWLEPLTVTVPSLLHYCDVDRSKSDLSTVRWKTSRPMNVDI
ncbi:uncharacterized protein LOC120086987 [Benincasa hispida]|uniref:uncharacterized protein LOC120086987 n=1 Tax=Benincasa hispida TaxID=102211 RepID=UPI0018FFDABC|nr:uncharacterized protein LOC120086987 [Benincasa hispida]XP_038899754.1 uncharacterized protein LOC120086987 [Benincasa hispida]